MAYDDYELIYMVKENEEAFDYLVKKYEPLFKKLAFSFVKKYKNFSVDVDDVIQQFRITLCYALDRYDPNRDVLFYSYLLSSLKKTIARYIRNFINYPICYIDSDKCDNNYFVSFGDIYREYDDYEYESSIVDFKNSLLLLDSQIFELRYNGFSYNDIAILLDINIKKVDNVLTKVRKKLEKYFLFS